MCGVSGWCLEVSGWCLGVSGWCLRVSGRCLVVTKLKPEKILALLGQNRSENEPKAIFSPKNYQKLEFGLRRGFFGPNQKVQKTKYVFTRPIHPPEVELNQNFEIGTLSPPSTTATRRCCSYGGERFDSHHVDNVG